MVLTTNRRKNKHLKRRHTNPTNNFLYLVTKESNCNKIIDL